MRRLLPAAVAAALVVLFTVPGAALASHVECGDVITKDTTLDSDVECKVGDTGAIGPDGQGYALLIGADGIRLDLAGHEVLGLPMLAGYEIYPVGILGHDHVTVANGTMREQLTLRDADHNRLVNLVVFSFVSSGIRLDASRHNVIERVRASSSFGDPMQLINGSDRNRVRYSDFGGEQTGIDVRASDGNVFRHNTIGGYDVGLWVRSGSDRTVVRHNELSSGYMGDGLRVAAGSRFTRVRGNTSSGNQDDGFDIDEPTTRLEGNTANNNGDLGIEAVSGVFGRGNVASGNGNPLQCTGVVCR